MAELFRRVDIANGIRESSQLKALKQLSRDLGDGGATGEGGGSQFLVITETDVTDPTYYYYGGTRPGGQWQINRYLKSDVDQRTEADENSNGGYATLAAAWPDRTTLTYS